MTETASAAMAAEPPLKEATAADAPASARRRSLLSPALDALMIGGASIVLYAIAHLYLDKGENINQISWVAFYLAWAVNNPHFMASYLLLYWDKRAELLKRPSYLWAGLVAPSLLLLYLVFGVVTAQAELLGYAVNAMFFLVGWHYVKQIYGTVIVSAAGRGYYFSKREALALKLNLLPVWMVSFLNANTGVRNQLHYGVGYKTFAIPGWIAQVNYGLLAVSLLGLLYLLLRKWAREGKTPGLTAMCSFAAIYVWYLPKGYHPHFWYLIPLFHSLQYMLFVTALKRGQFAGEAAERLASEPDRGEEARLVQAGKLLGFFVAIVLLGMCTFQWIPLALDRGLAYDRQLFGAELFMFLFITFINIHHYFIDNVIWRRDNPALKNLYRA